MGEAPIRTLNFGVPSPDILAMKVRPTTLKKSGSSALKRWRISRIKATPAVEYGTVERPMLMRQWRKYLNASRSRTSRIKVLWLGLLRLP